MKIKWINNTLDRLGYTHRDRAGQVEVWYKYANQDIAKRRFPQTQYDILAQNVNANVRVCHRAIGEAIRSLPLQIVSTEMAADQITQVVDLDHPANDLFKHPNDDMTLSQILHHNSDSYLGDGNAYVTIEVMTGPNGRIELWPRDPRQVERLLVDDRPVGYKIGRGSLHTVNYKKTRIIHIRAMDVTDPLYGKPRHEAVRGEIELDNYVNRFNRAFFKNGAVFSQMFTPSKNLTAANHQQLLAAMKEDTTGEDNWYTFFINRFAGKIESPKQKHADIAFIELLTHNREKIYAAFGLPPFRGGVMQYANYANAAMQDKDFWQNTIKPIMTVLLDAYNKQLVWPYFGDDISIRANYNEIPALKGDKKDQAEVHEMYINSGALTIDEVREELGRDPLPEEEKKKQIPMGKEDESKEPTEPKEEEKKEAKPTQKEKKSLTFEVYRALRKQRRLVIERLDKHTANGEILSGLFPAEACAVAFFPTLEMNAVLFRQVLPICQGIVRLKGSEGFRAGDLGGEFDATADQIENLSRLIEIKLSQLDTDTQSLLIGVLAQADHDNWSYTLIRRHINNLFTLDRAKYYALPLIETVYSQTEAIIHNQLARVSDEFVTSKTRKEPTK